jgi:hypothetical protein
LQDINAVVGDDGDYSLRVSGFLQDATGLAGSELQVSAKGASVAEIAALAGVGGMPDLPFTAAATLLRGERHTVIDNGSVVVGGNRLNFSGRVGDQPLRDDLELDFSIAVDKLDALVASFDVDTANVPRGKLAASGGIHSEAGRWIAENIEVQLGGATLTVAGTVGRPPEMNATALEWRLTGDSLNELLPPRLQSDAPGQTFEVSGLASIADREATLGKIVAAAGNISLRGDVTVSFSSPMQSGRASIRAQSPDVYQMFPHWRQPSGPQRADLGISGDVSWRDNYWEFDGVEARVADGRLLLDGSIDGPPSFDRTDLELDVTAQSLSELGFLAGRPLPDQPLKLKVRLRGAPDVMTIEPFELTVGPSDVHGRAELREGEVPAVRIELTSRLLDLTDFFPAAESVPDDKAGASVAKDRLIPDTPLPLDLLQTFELDITANAGQFRTRTFRWTDVMLNAEVDDGALNVRRFSRTGPRGGEIQLVSTLSPSGGGAADIGLQVHGSKLILGLGGADAKDIPDLPLYEFDTELEGRGATVRDVAGSLDGYVRVVGSAGRFKASSLTFFTQDFLNQLLRTLNPFIAKDPYTRVECSALLFRIDNGIATGKPALVQQTEKLRILGNAEINLQTEKIGAEFTTVPQKGLGIGISNLVNPYIKLTGTLAKPALTVNPEGVLVDGGLAVATGGLSILAKGFKDRFLSQKDACSKAISEADTLFGLPQS